MDKYNKKDIKNILHSITLMTSTIFYNTIYLYIFTEWDFDPMRHSYADLSVLKDVK